MLRNGIDIETQQRIDLNAHNLQHAQDRERRILRELGQRGITKIYEDAGPSGRPRLGQHVGSFDDLVMEGPIDIHTRKRQQTFFSASIATSPFPYTPLSEAEIASTLAQGQEKLKVIDARLTQFNQTQADIFPGVPLHQPMHRLITAGDEPVLLTERIPGYRWDSRWKVGEIGTFEIPDVIRQHLETVKVAHELGLTFKPDYSMNPLYTHFLNSYLLNDGRYVNVPNFDYAESSSDPRDLYEDRTAILRLVLSTDREIQAQRGRQQLSNRDRAKIEVVLAHTGIHTTDEGLLEVFREFPFMKEADIRRLLTA